MKEPLAVFVVEFCPRHLVVVVVEIPAVRGVAVLVVPSKACLKS